MDGLPVATNENFEPLKRLLESVSRLGNYYAAGTASVPMPRIEVDGVGVIPFPVPSEMCIKLAQQASRAPYGKGEMTLIDTAVRNSWQIETDKVSIGGLSWDETFGGILEQVTAELGFPEGGLTAELYKLLIYERGGFFAPHRDTEKSPSMVATLVIALPVAGSGGELVVRSRDREHVIDMRALEPSEIKFAAFYADCTHEIRPVEEGHRVTLVYNLISNAAPDKIAATAPDHDAKIRQAADWLAELKNADSLPAASTGRGEWLVTYEDGERLYQDVAVEPLKIVWPLEHGYSEAGLAFADLKGIDRTHAAILKEAAEKSGFTLHAAILHVEIMGMPTGNWYGFGSGEPDHDVGIEEVFDDQCWLDHWAAPDGFSPSFGQVPLREGELVPSDNLREITPDSEWISEATGNEGATIERAYRIAALALWPHGTVAKVLAAAGIGHLIEHLAAERARPGADRAEIRELGRQLVEAWPRPPPHQARRWSEDCTKGLEQLVGLGDRDSLARFLSGAVMANYTGGENETIMDGAVVLGDHEIWRTLPEFVGKNLPHQASRVIDLASGLFRMIGKAVGTANPDLFPAVARRIAECAPAALRSDPQPVLSPEAVAGAVALLSDNGLSAEAVTLASEFASVPEAADPFRTLPQALEAMASVRGGKLREHEAFGTLWRRSAETLLERSGAPPAPPADWRIPLTLDQVIQPRTSQISTGWQSRYLDTPDELEALGAQLVEFCNDPHETTWKFAVRQSLRSSLKGTISRLRLDIGCHTEEKGRPYKLVCTKNRKSYRRRLKEYRADIAAIRALISVAPGHASESDLQRLRRATELSP